MPANTETVAALPPILIEAKGQFCIWQKDGRRPRAWHDTLDIAMAEAERLARAVPGKKFIVMQALCKVSQPVEATGEPQNAEAA
jgi:hypothetical protein